jgi:DNA-binding MarR family transcriptional regulator
LPVNSRSAPATPGTAPETTPEQAEQAEQAELASRLRLAVARLSRRIRQQAAATGDELTASAQATLATVEHRGPVSLGELAAVEQVQPPSMTRIIARLEEWGYVLRAVDPTDRRIARVAITDDGRELLARSRTRKDVFLAQRVAGLSDADRARLQRALPILEHLLDDEP